MRIFRKLTQTLLTLFVLMSVIPLGTVSALEVETLNEQVIRLHYTDASPHYEHLTAYPWGEENSVVKNEGLSYDTPLSFKQNEGDYPYTDIQVSFEKDNAKLGLILLNDHQKMKDSDTFVDISKSTKNLWVDQSLNITDQEPVAIKDRVQIGIKNENVNPDTLTMWVWTGFHPSVVGKDFNTDRVKPSRIDEDFIYFDLPILENAQNLEFLFHYGESQSNDYNYQLDSQNRDLYTAKGDPNIYHNMELKGYNVNGARWVESRKIQIDFGKAVDDIEPNLMKLKQGDTIIPYTFSKKYERGGEVTVDQDLDPTQSYSVEFDGRSKEVIIDWTLMDTLYGTDQELGLVWESGKPKVNLWSPSAQSVELVVYDKDQQSQEIGRIPMVQNDNVWTVANIAEQLGMQTIQNAYYQFAITRQGQTVYALDPYAKSMATWNGLNREGCSSQEARCVGKAAFVALEGVVDHLNYANLGEGYQGSEDAIIYEVHVRDFTSDQALSDLENPFGTFDAFIEKLPYLKSLGVTHIQMLPLMSYFNIDEANRDTRVWDYTKQGASSNYNWGYDPHSYFSLSGVYSQDANNAAQRLKEFAKLVDAIHNEGMGIIMDVVYNHTASVSIFEDL